MANYVSWPTVTTTAKFVSDRYPGASESELRELEEDLAEIVPQALAEVAEFTSLKVPDSSLEFRVVSRAQWIDANVDGYKFLLDKVVAKSPVKNPLPGSEHISGAGLGSMLGWISSRVLGQYDLLLQQGAESNSGAVYFVGPNLIQIERRFGFQKRQFRHWVALHELTHRAQFEGVPWFRGYFSGLVDELINISTPDFSALLSALPDLLKSVASGENPFAEFGLAGLFVSEDQVTALRKTTALMSIAEGHGDWVMDRAAKEAIPEAWQFSKTLANRRSSATGISKLLQSLLGLEAKLNQYARGEEFIRAVESARPGVSSHLWDSSSMIPLPEEFDSPQLWIERVTEALALG